MSCEKPLLALRLAVLSDGSQKIKILSKNEVGHLNELESKYGADLLALPCGKCPACLAARKREWSIRCSCEATLHPRNCFVTLTYSDEQCPKKLDKSHLRSFIKNLRNKGYKIRYYGCGEYGCHTLRPHYHIILFGLFPDDAKPLSKSHSGFWLYESDLISSCWNRGRITVQEFTPETAAYVAGYVDKKMDDLNCFTIMSTHPGIGGDYLLNNLDKIYKYDNVVVKGYSHAVKIPRYFDKLASQKIDLDWYKVVRMDGAHTSLIRYMQSHGIVHREDAWQLQGKEYSDKLKRKHRGL